jgi:hypothetical protein
VREGFSTLIGIVADDITARLEASFRPGKTGSFPNPNAKMVIRKSYIYGQLILSVYIVLVSEQSCNLVVVLVSRTMDKYRSAGS